MADSFDIATRPPPTLTLPRKGGGDSYFTLAREGRRDSILARSLDDGGDSCSTLPLEGGGRGGGDGSTNATVRLILSLSKDEAPASLMVRQAHREAALHG